MNIVSKSSVIGVALALIAIVSACSRADQTLPPDTGVRSRPVTYESYDSSVLTEVRSLSDLPSQLSTLIGWHRKCCNMVDVSEDFQPSDVMGGPAYRFLVGGISDNSALIAYEEGTFGLNSFATAYVHDASGWTLVGRWKLDMRPTTLQEVKTWTNRHPDS